MKNFELLANVGEGYVDNQKINIIKSDIPLQSSLKLIDHALKECDTCGISKRIINSYISIICIDFKVSSDKRYGYNYFKKYHEFYSKSLNSKDYLVISINSDIRRKYSPTLTPLSVYPFKEKIIADLMLGRKMIQYYVNISEIFSQFERENWKVFSSFIDLSGDYNLKNLFFCKIKRNDFDLTVPWSIFNQIVFDLISFDSVIALFNFIYSQKLRQSGALFVSFKDEESVWR